MVRPALAPLLLALAWLIHAATTVLAQDAPAAIDEPLTAVPGDAARGLAIVRNAANATCLICHTMPIPEEPNHGTLGPPLDGVADRYSEGELRLRIVDAKRANPESIMPAYYRKDGLYRVDAPYANRTIYTAQEVEDVVAYLMTLKAR
jgi:sulfur-oxidizing protein SoxX